MRIVGTQDLENNSIKWAHCAYSPKLSLSTYQYACSPTCPKWMEYVVFLTQVQADVWHQCR